MKYDLVLLHAPSVYDFRKNSLLAGPISDVVPSSPVFEMYPIGITSIAEYLERYSLRVKIINIANRMLMSDKFDVEAKLKNIQTKAFGIDLHWLPHAHGSIEVARLVKKLHPITPVIFGGLQLYEDYANKIRHLMQPKRRQQFRLDPEHRKMKI
ncbi:cobalamin-dependent protein [Bacillus sp. X1(2014)]|uniref:cobalamin-dependent protein n=1 Tax=Bacillus sp. X1(2014) TaxID=1565991 RepID=UPI0021B171C4|nr:cobalamin-dependent protein [Bacillus sp. X1(2014)]